MICGLIRNSGQRDCICRLPKGHITNHRYTYDTPTGRKTVPAATSEAVDHPAHYGGGDNPYEVIKVLEAWLTPEQMSGFCLGNTIKYVARAGKKGSKIEDLKKARFYLDREITNSEKK